MTASESFFEESRDSKAKKCLFELKAKTKQNSSKSLDTFMLKTNLSCPLVTDFLVDFSRCQYDYCLKTKLLCFKQCSNLSE